MMTDNTVQMLKRLHWPSNYMTIFSYRMQRLWACNHITLAKCQIPLGTAEHSQRSPAQPLTILPRERARKRGWLQGSHRGKTNLGRVFKSVLQTAERDKPADLHTHTRNILPCASRPSSFLPHELMHNQTHTQPVSVNLRHVTELPFNWQPWS